jgi:hypothetical protein
MQAGPRRQGDVGGTGGGGQGGAGQATQQGLGQSMGREEKVKLTKSKILNMPAGGKMNAIINERFYREDRPRLWSESDADAVILMQDVAERIGFITVQSDPKPCWIVMASVGRKGIPDDAAEGETLRLAICRFALLVTLEKP